MQRTCVVFPSSRAIRDVLAGCEESFLPTYMGMGDFLDRAVLTHSLVSPDDDLRLLALHEASDFSSFSNLQIERNFFTFIQNSQYIFRFFEELSGEMVSIDALELSDVYGEYEEHIAILRHLLHRYAEAVQARRWADPIFSKQHITLNEEYLGEYDSILIHIEGYLSRYELKVLQGCATIVPLECIYHATAYNEKMSDRLRELSLDIIAGHRYRFSLSDLRVLEKSVIQPLENIVCEVFHSRLVQVGFVKAKIAQMVAEGIAPERIAVIVPDESFAEYLRLFDYENNLNFAMGTSLAKEQVLRDIEAVELYLDEQSAENKARLSRVSEDLSEWIRNHYYRNFTYDDLCSACEIMVQYMQSDAAKNIIHEELQKFKPLSDALKEIEFKSAFRIFFNRLKSRSIDDIGGGKITVMGLLETRGIQYDGVIVVDFNEGYVPHRSQKDLFLNTTVRKLADLPTTADREALQKHYYWMLFNRARRVAIATVQNSESVPSRFLLQLGIRSREAQYDYGSVLMEKPLFAEREVKDIVTEYDFGVHPLSSSGLKSFLTCKRQFYYRYVTGLKDHEKPEDLSQEREIGNRLHNALEKVYTQQDHYSSAGEIKAVLKKTLEQYENLDVMQRYAHDLWIEKLDPFYENEIRRFDSGVRVMNVEMNGETAVEGIRLVGRMDRIDQTHEGLEVLDYKSGKYPAVNSDVKEGDTDFQLSIYGLLAENFGKVSRCGFYDLNTGKIEYEQFMESKTERLKAILRDLAGQKEWSWELTEEYSNCRFCPYITLCHREL